MSHRTFMTVLAASLLVGAAGCGKGTKDQGPTTTEAKVAEMGTPASHAAGGAAKPAMPPVKAAARGPERPAYSLVDNRLGAHLTRNGGLLVAAGSAGFAKYLRFGNVAKAKRAWELRQTEGDVKVARMTGKSATVFVPLTAAQAQKNVVRFRVHTRDGGAISVRVNENKDLNNKVEAGWQTVELPVPAGQLHEGENAIQLFMKDSGAALAWLQVGGTAAPAEGPITFFDATQKALLVPQGSQMSWYAFVPEKARLAADLSDGACTVAVVATGEDGQTIEGKLVGTGSAVDLGAIAGKAARIDLETTGCPQAAISNAAIVVPGEAPQIKRGAPPKHVLFIIMDSLRADRVRAFNPKARAEAPTFEKLAETGTLFMQHYVQGNESQVSHASMWTSMYLAKHRASKMGDKLPEKYFTIDEVAKKTGMYVAGVSANGYIRPERGFGKSWDRFTNHITEKKGLKGVDVIEAGVNFITPKKDQPWFLYLGTIDTHVTWRAKSPWIEKYSPGYSGRFEKAFGDDGPGGFAKDLSDKEKEHVRALYDSNVSYQDDQLAKLIEKLKGWGVWDQTMLIITADHGDEQWEDGRVGHAGSQKQTLIHVPLLIHYPPMFPAAKIASGSEGVDITPTVADALGVGIDPEWQGMSLMPVAHGAVAYPLIATSSQYDNAHGARLAHWKLQLKGTNAPVLHNLAKDPGERTDLWGKPEASIAARVLLDPMWTFRQWNEEWKKSQWGNIGSVSSRFAADLGE